MKAKLFGTLKSQTIGLETPVWVHILGPQDDLMLSSVMDGLIICYKVVFAGPPYFENYQGKESFISSSFQEFLKDGIVVLASNTETLVSETAVVGFGAAIRADRSEVAEFLSAHPQFLTDDVKNYLYMAELGVITGLRKQGLGRKLILARTEEARRRNGFSHLIMRTAKEGSNARRIYERLGAKEIPGLIQNKDEFGTESKARIFLTMKL